ncbi:ribosomal protein S18 acetylase RimI-like enzyme [Agromyces hippuratus]|uniref:Ribosomal protein S18 acetylase RimI-like enzyme n=1 Tax=Agromyces hippuratus TaxID=286438 RepID=A0A852WNT8_9MICO|nr:GNAT family N-acetyltransferase [Agromyces hippuratus]NYG19802.1 ribosomal protein S18 acetylase RimI-like enzyme [Agromyces hippuratus]
MLTFVLSDPTTESSRSILRRYYDDIIGRYNGRPATTAEVDETLIDEPSDDLQGETGAFIVARESERVLGCAGVRYIEAEIGELTRVFITPEARGRGLGAALIGEIERIAEEHGVRRMRLDVRGDLVEAQRLYRRAGYREVPAFSDAPYADHWMAKDLIARD